MTPPGTDRYSDGFKRGLWYGRDLYKGKVIRWLKARHRIAHCFSLDTPESEYWKARHELLALLIKEVEDL